MDMNEIVEDNLDKYIKKIVFKNTRKIKSQIRKNLNNMIEGFKFDRYVDCSCDCEKSPIIYNKMVCLCNVLYKNLTGKMNERQLKLFLFNCEKFFKLEDVERFTNHVCNYLEFIKDDLEKCK